ncbi:MAG: ABC transporter substrate-binding protein [Steroidobacteraceae bacterium]
MKSILVSCAISVLLGVGTVSWAQAAQDAKPTPATADAAAQADNPNALIEKVAQDVLKDLDANRAQYNKNPKLIRQLVDKHLLPHFDTEYAARLVLARHWKTATPEQRKRFVDAFYQSLLQNYGEALLDFTPDRLKVLPFRGEGNADSATVKTEVRRDNGQRVPVNYSMHRTPDGWKAWDVTIEGISYIRSFRTDFNSEIQQRGLEAVIARLESQIASGQAPKPTATPKPNSAS